MKWNKYDKCLEFGPHWYIQFMTYIKGVWDFGIGYDNNYYCPSVHISLFKFSIHIGRSKI